MVFANGFGAFSWGVVSTDVAWTQDVKTSNPEMYLYAYNQLV